MTNSGPLVDGMRELNIDANDDIVNMFKGYKELLKEWNEKINITAIKDDKEIDIKHFVDSLTVLKSGYIKDGQRIIDIGTGGGFPGLPLKIVVGELDVVLLDSLNKRINFLNEVISTLGLKNIKAIHGRAEDFGSDKEYRETFDVAVSRAVASLNVLCEYSLPFVKVGGYFISMKGPDIDEEISEAKKAISTLGGIIEEKIDLKLPNTDIHHTLVIIKKISNTPTKYPRKAGKPTKNPL